jgi:hypothetical protein
MGDQLVARPLLTAPGECDNDGEVGGTNGFGRGNMKYSEKTFPDATLSTTNPTCQTRARTRAGAVGSQRLTASAMARPANYKLQINKLNQTHVSRTFNRNLHEIHISCPSVYLPPGGRVNYLIVRKFLSSYFVPLKAEFLPPFLLAWEQW